MSRSSGKLEPAELGVNLHAELCMYAALNPKHSVKWTAYAYLHKHMQPLTRNPVCSAQHMHAHAALDRSAVCSARHACSLHVQM